MKKLLFLLGLFVIVFIPNSLFAQFKVGFAERDITPQPDMEVPGGYGKKFFEKKPHDSLKVRVGVFANEDQEVAFVGVDALVVPASVVTEARQRIQRQVNIDPSSVMVGASHTHSGGPTGMVQPGQFDEASSFVRKLAYEQSSVANKAYLQEVSDAIVYAVTEAYNERLAAKACVGSGHEEDVGFNRRFYMKNGLTYTHPRYGNPDIDTVAGPIDPEVGVIGVWDQSDQFMGCVVNYANHATNGAGGSVTADYIYYLEKTIRGVMGQDAVVVFLNGAAGDVTQVNNLSPDNIDYGLRSARFVGTSIGAEALKVLTHAEPGKLLPLDSKSKVIEIPRRKPSREHVKESREIIKKDSREVGRTRWTFAKETVLADAFIDRNPLAEVEVQAIQVGPAIFVSNPAEYFCQLGLDIKRRSDFPYTYVVGFANGSIGYVPTMEAFGPHGGGYETRLTLYSNLGISAGDQIKETSVRLVKSFNRGPVPRPPQKAPFRGPWRYGSVPPQVE